MTDRYTVADLSAYDGERSRVGVGYRFDGGFDDGDIAVRPGDVCVFDDPDAGMHAGECELIHSHIETARVNVVYAVDYDTLPDGTYAVEVGTTGALGRLGVTDRCVGIQHYDGDGGPSYYGGLDPSVVEREARAFRASDASDSRRVVSHLGRDGTPADLWDTLAADERGRSGPHCPVCTGEEGTDGTVIKYD